MTIKIFSTSQVDTKGHMIFPENAETVQGIVSERFPDIMPVTFIDAYCCTNCDQVGYFDYDTETDTLTATEPCELAESGGIYTLKLEVPSGAIAVSDNLINVFSPDRKERPGMSLNTFKGREEYAKFYATEKEFIYGSILISPEVYWVPETKELYVARLELDEETEEPIIPEGWVPVADIILDLWAYCISDWDKYVEKGGDPHQVGVTRVEVPAGTYTFTHYANQRDFDADDIEGDIIFAKAQYEG